MQTIVTELATVIRKKRIGLSEVAKHIGCSPEEVFEWLLGFAEPPNSFLKILPGVIADLDLLYLDAAERKA